MRRFVFAPRWIVGHVLVLIAIVSCLMLGDWQLGRAEVTHSLQNMAYALQWPLFAVFFAVSWWRMLRLESRRLDEEAADAVAESESGADPVQPARASASESSRPEPARPEPAQSEPPRSIAAQPASDHADEDDDPELTAYNRMLAELAARDQAAEAARDHAAQAPRRR